MESDHRWDAEGACPVASAAERRERGREITVGVQGADISGCDDRAIQMAIDDMATRDGGGIVRLQPGTYTLTGPVRLRSHVSLIGAGADTILRLGPVVSSSLAVDADIGEKQIQPKDPSGFKPGMGVILRDRTKSNSISTMPLTITEVRDGRLLTREWINHDWCAENGAVVLNHFPLIHGFEIEAVCVEDLVLDGEVTDVPESLQGVWGGNLYLRRVDGAVIRNVESRRCVGDGLRCGQSRNIVMENCRVHHNSEYGIHPGSHTKRVRITDSEIHSNGSDGLYVCWGVQHSTFAGNVIHHNGHIRHRTGFCIGHKDTDNVIENNHVFENHKHGIHIRTTTAANGAHRNVFRNNRIENNGVRIDQVPEDLRAKVPEQELLGCGIYVNGATRDLRFENNTVRETRTGDERVQVVGLYVGPDVSGTVLEGNRIEGHPDEDVVARDGM